MSSEGLEIGALIFFCPTHFVVASGRKRVVALALQVGVYPVASNLYAATVLKRLDASSDLVALRDN